MNAVHVLYYIRNTSKQVDQTWPSRSIWYIFDMSKNQQTACSHSRSAKFRNLLNRTNLRCICQLLPDLGELAFDCLSLLFDSRTCARVSLDFSLLLHADELSFQHRLCKWMHDNTFCFKSKKYTTTGLLPQIRPLVTFVMQYNFVNNYNRTVVINLYLTTLEMSRGRMQNGQILT